jgi:tetratricopeptide (TPR) repeat protein
MIKGSFILFLLISGFTSEAQLPQNKAKAKELLLRAIKTMDNGDPSSAITTLDSARQMDPTDFVYDYEMAFAFQMLKDHNSAIKHLETAVRFANANDQCYQMLGNNYDYNGDRTKAIEVYKEGLKKFPNSGKLYVELGVIAQDEKEYDKAIECWEKGISVDPLYASNYYRLAKLFSLSTDRIWAIFYGEMFLNMEWNSKRTEEISKIIYNAYKQSISVTSDSSLKVDFARNMVLVNPGKDFQLPFDQVYGLDFSVGISILLVSGKKELNIATLNTARTAFIKWWYDHKREKDYPNILLDFQKKVFDNGHMEAYNYWVFMSGAAEEFAEWIKVNEKKFNEFAEWFNKNAVEVNDRKYFIRK